jgi:post-segregation antitoxin (ccd killing protein)
MSQRINISIPDSLFDRLQPYKDAINVSKLCQDAIDREIKKKEDFKMRMNEAPGMEETIARLREEKMMRDKAVTELGRKDGIEWAKIAHYDDIMVALDGYHPGRDGDLAGSLGDDLVRYLEKKINYDPKEDLDDLEENYDDESEDGPLPRGHLLYIFESLPDHVRLTEWNHQGVEIEYFEGFYEGIREFWNSVKDRI